tara:strand:- start:242 stop:505 length:264 start_codon:yes stop_codon:yes gene_type:complete
MVLKDYSINNSIIATKFGNHVEGYIGSSYCILSCSKHDLSEFVSVIDDLCSKGWTASTGITSEDGKIYQSLSKISTNGKYLTKDIGV